MDFARKHLEETAELWKKKVFGQKKSKLTRTLMMEKGKRGRRKNSP